ILIHASGEHRRADGEVSHAVAVEVAGVRERSAEAGVRVRERADERPSPTGVEQNAPARPRPWVVKAGPAAARSRDREIVDPIAVDVPEADDARAESLRTR